MVSPQTLNECYRVLTARRKLVPEIVARSFVAEFAPFCQAPIDASTTQLAFTVQDALRGSWWDCVMFASALQAGCRLFLSEDMQAGREFAGLRIVDPFTTSVDLIVR